MNTQSQNASRSTTPTPNSLFAAPEFRTRVIEILSRTANGCLQELNYRPGMPHQLAELQNRVNNFQDENNKLFEDNQRFAQSLKSVQDKYAARERHYTGTIQSLEQRVMALQNENHALAAGHPDYAHLHAEYMQLKEYCSQLKQQIAALQNMMMMETPFSPFPPQKTRVVPGEQLAASKPLVPQSVQEGFWKQQPGQGQNVIPPGQQVQAQPTPFHPVRTHINTPSVPGVQNISGNKPGTPTAASSTQSLPHANQVLLSHATPAPTISRLLSSTYANDTMEIDPRALKYTSSKPVIHGWANDAPYSNSSQPPRLSYSPPHPMLPRQQVPAPPVPQGQNSPPTVPSIPTMSLSSIPAASPATSGAFLHSRYYPTMIGSSLSVVPQPPPGYTMDVVPIGPPGKLLPPLTASVMKPLSPSSSARPPSSTQAPHLASKPVVTTQRSSSVTDLTNASPVEPQLPSQPSQTQLSVSACTSRHKASTEEMQTPHLTPSSSRGSAGPSEGISEVVTPVTPLDVPTSHIVSVVGSPAIGFGHPHGSSAEPRAHSVDGDTDPDARYRAAILASKRGSSSISGGDDSEENAIHDPECVRKKPRLEEGVDVSSMNSDAPGIAPLQAMEEEGEEEEEDEEEEEEEFGPDGLRTIKYCLDAFTDENDDGIPACVLCLKRYEEGLIQQPATFPSDTPQEVQLKHFLSEHLKVWEDFRNQGMIG